MQRASSSAESPPRASRICTDYLESAFDDTKPYVLTALGREFVHYTMNELVTRISEESSPASDV